MYAKLIREGQVLVGKPTITGERALELLGRPQEVNKKFEVKNDKPKRR